MKFFRCASHNLLAKRLRPVIVSCLIFLSWTGLAADLSTHPIIRLYLGKWTAEGELRGQDGNIVNVSQTWEGKADGENAFLIQGSRTVNGETQSYSWRITHNAATDLIEAALIGQDGNQLRFEAQASEAASTLTLKAVTGSGMSSITVTDVFSGEDKDTLETKVLFTGEQGETTLEGTLISKRQRAP